MQAYQIPYSEENDLRKLIEAVGVEPAALKLLCGKAQHRNIMLKKVKTSWANIIKQEMLAAGGDAAISRHSYACKEDFTDVILMGTKTQINYFMTKMKMQPECFNVVVDAVERAMGVIKPGLNIGGKHYDLAEDFLVLGVLNVTPDSFSDGGKYLDKDSAVKRAEELVNQGADIVDIGGESTRPQSHAVSEQEEIERVLPVIEAVTSKLGISVSVDSYKPQVIKEALRLGAVVVNDISGGAAVDANLDLIKKHDASVIVMMNISENGLMGHTPITDHKDPELMFMDFCEQSRERFLSRGIGADKIILDPGIGFGLSVNDTSRILGSISSVTSLGYAVCAGVSRKSYLGKISGLNIDARDGISNSISLYLMERGVKIFRTHDPAGLTAVIKAYKALIGV